MKILSKKYSNFLLVNKRFDANKNNTQATSKIRSNILLNTFNFKKKGFRNENNLNSSSYLNLPENSHSNFNISSNKINKKNLLLLDQKNKELNFVIEKPEISNESSDNISSVSNSQFEKNNSLLIAEIEKLNFPKNLNLPKNRSKLNFRLLESFCFWILDKNKKYTFIRKFN